MGRRPTYDHDAILAYFAGHTAKETAELFGCPVHAVATIARRRGWKKPGRVTHARGNAFKVVACELGCNQSTIRRRTLSILSREPDIVRNLLDGGEA